MGKSKSRLTWRKWRARKALTRWRGCRDCSPSLQRWSTSCWGTDRVETRPFCDRALSACRCCPTRPESTTRKSKNHIYDLFGSNKLVDSYYFNLWILENSPDKVDEFCDQGIPDTWSWGCCPQGVDPWNETATSSPHPTTSTTVRRWPKQRIISRIST